LSATTFAAKSLTQKLDAAYEKTRGTPVKELLDVIMANDLTDPMDLQVRYILDNDPIAASISNQIKASLATQTKAIAHGLLLSSGLTSDTKGSEYYPEIYKLYQESLKKLGFSTTSIARARLHVINSPQINAFTYSGLDGLPEVVVYKGLIDNLSPKEVQAVLGHELAHIKNRHVYHSMMLEFLFFETGRILIPASQQFFLLQKMQARLDSLIQERLFAAGGASPQITSAIKANLTKTFREISTHLRENFSQEELFALTSKLTATLDRKESSESEKADSEPSPLQTAEMNEDDMADMMDMKAQMEEFQKRMARLSRSAEKSSDQWGSVVAGADNSANALIRLAIGTEGDPRAALEQAKEAERILRENPLVRGMVTESSSHPNLMDRATYLAAFSKQDVYQLYHPKNAFKRSLRDYTILTDQLESLDQNPNAAVYEGSEFRTMQANRSDLTDFLSALSDILSDAIVEEIKKDNRKTYPHSEQLIAFLHDLGYTLGEEHFKQNRFLPKLKNKLIELPQSQAVALLVQQIEERTPPNSKRSAIEEFRHSSKGCEGELSAS